MSSVDQILDVAERRMRQAGYNAVSFRDIAGEIGIKSASLHYHFPKKEDLGVALVQRYVRGLSDNLSSAIVDLTQAPDILRAYVKLYRDAFGPQRLACLCAVLGAEVPGLPGPVAAEVEKFFRLQIKWLTRQFANLGAVCPENSAKATLALLEGAMIISSVNDDPEIFQAAEEMILNVAPQRQNRTAT